MKLVHNPVLVVHCKHSPYDVYIGRPSVWGNPFVIGHDGTRAEVIKKFYDWIKQQPELMQSVLSLKGKRLGCWCSPNLCHGDVLIRIIDELESELFFKGV